MVRLLDVDRGDVVGEQVDLVRVQLLAELAWEIRIGDQIRVDELRDERARPDERIEHVHARSSQRTVELLAQDVVHATQDEFHDLGGRIHDAEPFARLLHGHREEALVQELQEVLLARGILEARNLEPHARIEGIEAGELGVEVRAVQRIEHPLHGLRDRVVLREAETVEEGIEHRLGDEVLREHLERVVFGDTVVEVVPQPLHEPVELAAHLGARIEQALDAQGLCGSDIRHARRPVLPVLALADLLHDLRVDGRAPLVAERSEIERHLGDGAVDLDRALTRLERLHADDLNLVVLRGPVQLELIDLRLEAFVVGAEGAQHLPDDLVLLVVVEGDIRLDPGRHRDRQDDVAVALALELAHDAADALNDIHLAVARVQEDHRVERGNVDALAQTAGVVQDARHIALRILLEPVEQLGALHDVHGAVDVLGLHDERVVSALQ